MVQVEFKETQRNNSEVTSANKRGAKAKRASKGGLPLKNFLSVNGGMKAALKGGARGAGMNLTDAGDLGLGEEDWGSHGAKLAEIANFNQYEKLFAHLQGMVNFPALLGNHGMEDTINSRLVFDENSHCDWSKSRVGGTLPAYRVYTLALLKKLCAMKTIEHLHFRKNQFVDVNFTFAILSLPEPPGMPQDTLQANVMSYRRTFIKPRFEVHAGPLQWTPLAPNMVFLDFPWIFEHWDKWVEGHDPMDDFRER